MAREEKPCCVLTLPLQTELWQEHIIEKRFAIMEHLKNQLIAMELRKLKNLQRTRAYKELAKQIEEASKEKRGPLYRQRQKMLRDAGFSEFDFKDDMAGKKSEMQKHFAEHVAAQIAHKAASDVWRSFEKYLFNSGRAVHYHKRGSLSSVACQTAGNGMNYADGQFIWSGGLSPNKIVLRIPVEPPRNEYEQEMLQKKLKTLRIVRKWMKTRYKYYLQLTFEGLPVQKKRKRGHGRVGIDIGPRTVAIVSEKKAMLLELADRVEENHRRILLLQQKMDRSRRAMNPEYYHEDGTIKRPPKGERYHWKYSNHYRRLAGKVRELQRKNAAIRKWQHTCLANEVLAMGDRIYVEQMSFSGLQRRVKETTKDEKGRFRKKKRFGKSLANKAPAELISLIKTKAPQIGAECVEVNTQTFKASRYDHTDDGFHPAQLSDRWKTLSNGDTVQRDLYSAFLLMNSNEEHTQTDRTLCMETYARFRKNHNKEIARIRTSGRKYPASFGI